MEEQQQPENGVDRILTTLLDQLAALQRQVTGMTSERLPTPPDVEERGLPEAHELQLEAGEPRPVQVWQIQTAALTRYANCAILAIGLLLAIAQTKRPTVRLFCEIVRAFLWLVQEQRTEHLCLQQRTDI